MEINRVVDTAIQQNSDMLGVILNYLEYEDSRTARKVCRVWHQALERIYQKRVHSDYGEHARVVEIRGGIHPIDHLGSQWVLYQLLAKHIPLKEVEPGMWKSDEKQALVCNCDQIFKNASSSKNGCADYTDLLVAATLHGSEAVASFALEQGANIERMDGVEPLPSSLASLVGPEGTTLLHLAARWGHPTVVGCLLKRVPSFATLPNKWGDLPLHAAITGMSQLVPLGIPTIGLDPEHPWKRLARNPVMGLGHLEVVKRLLEISPETVNAKGCGEKLPLDLAMQQQVGDVAFFLINRGASLEGWTREGWNRMLHVAAYSGHLELAELALRGGADIDTVRDVNGHPTLSTLLVATQKQQWKTAQWLLGKGARIRSEEEYDLLSTIISLNGPIELMDSLLLRGRIDINQKETTDRSETLLHVAAREDSPVMVAALLERGATANSRSHDFDTPLHVAAKYGSPDIVRQLLGAGADIDAKDFHGQTALHNAVIEGQESVVRVLLEEQYKADPNATDNRGRSAAHYAAENDQDDIMQLLVEKKVDLEIQDYDFNRPRDLGGGKPVVVPESWAYDFL